MLIHKKGDGLDVVNIYSWDSYDTTWTPLGSPIENLGTIAGDNNFGIEDIAFANEGKTVAIGASGENKVYVYEYKDESSWVPLGDAIDPGDNNLSFGKKLTLNSDGTRLAVGDATWRDSSNVSVGKIYIYTYNTSSGEWTLAASMEGPDGEKNYFGFSVSFDDPGETLAVGAYARDSNTGFCQVFSFFANGSTSDTSTPTYVLVEKGDRIAKNIDGSDDVLNQQSRNGYSVSISSDGNKVAVSARNNASNPGYVHILFTSFEVNFGIF